MENRIMLERRGKELAQAVGPSFVPKTSDEKLLELTNTTNYNLVQRNGQRIYGGPPPGWTGPTPEKGCEIFVGKVPRDCYEDELVPIFSRVGKVYELRLMMDFSGSNRGYFFVRYTNREDAKRAVKLLNNYEIRQGKFLGVVQSVDNRKLWISGIPKNRSALEIKAEMERLTEGVCDVILYPSQTDKSKTRGYAFVEYESHRAAALARRKLVPTKIFLLGSEIEKVDWAEPENEVDEDVMSKVKILFIRNLMIGTTEATVHRIFEQLCDDKIERVKKTKDYAFVHFHTREAAQKALINSVDLVIDGSPIEVSWSKPVDKAVYNSRKNLTKLLCNVGQQGFTSFDSPLAQLNCLPPLPTINGFRGAQCAISPRGLVKMSSHANFNSGGLPTNGNICNSLIPPNGMFNSQLFPLSPEFSPYHNLFHFEQLMQHSHSLPRWTTRQIRPWDSPSSTSGENVGSDQ